MRNIRLFVVLAVLALAPPAGAQQPGKVVTVGVLFFPAQRPGWTQSLVPFDVLHGALRDLGYVQGQNAVILQRSASGLALLRDLAGDLVRQNAAVIVAVGAEAIQVARETSRTTPIVMLSFADPVEMGFVATLGRPGGNVTGVSLMTADLGEKRLALLKEALPRVSRVAVLWNPADAAAASERRRIQAAAEALGLSLVPAEIRTPADVEAAFTGARKARAGAAVVVLDPVTYAQGARIVGLAAKNRLPAMYGSRAFVERGGLMAYQPSNKEAARRVAVFVDKILKGAKPGDLPVEQPSEFELVVNMKTAGSLGLKIPPSVLVLAEQIFR